MATVQLIDESIFENVQLTDVKRVGDEGSKTATAHINGKTYYVSNSIIDGFNPIWYEQVSLEILKGTTRFVEGSIADETDK